MPPLTPTRTRATGEFCLWSAALLRVGVLDLALGDFLEGHRQVVLRPGLDQRRRDLERPLAELVVVVVDLPRALGGDYHERVARVHVLEQVVDLRVDHGREMVPAALRASLTRPTSSSVARSSSSLMTTWSNSPACCRWRCASARRSPISPALSVARSRSRRSSSANVGASTKIVTAPGTSSRTRSAPSVSRSRSGALPFARIRSISDRGVP